MMLPARLLVLATTAAALAALAPPQAHGQDPRLVGRLPEPTRAAVDALLDSARAQGIPTEALVDRALEGAAKGAGGDRIVAAVRRLAGELRTTREALGPESSPAELIAGASALRAGARPTELRELRVLRTRQPLTVAAAVLADLVAVGVPPDTAAAAVLALAREADDATYIAFRRNVERDVALGASPVAALELRLTSAADAFAQSGGPTSARGPRKP
jgi:hypothetical protein